MTNNYYDESKIYKIFSNKGDKIYIGSTTKQFIGERMAKHRSDYLKWKKGCKYTSKLTSFLLFDEYGLENCFITTIEFVACTTKNELLLKEASHIKKNIEKCVNKYVPLRTKTEYNNLNREKINKKAREYYHKKINMKNIDFTD